MKFYLGSHRANWLWRMDVPLFVSHVTLRARRTTFPRARTSWALDSGGFSELDRHSRFVTTPEEYVDAVRRYESELGGLEWASPQDWMCEPWMIEKTGLSIEAHQERTVENLLLLRELAPEVRWTPVVQGWEIDDYVTCVGLYLEAGIDLRDEPLVGVGSVCRRQSTDGIGEIFSKLTGGGISCHGYGVKRAGLRRYGRFLTSADSMAWSFRARRGQVRLDGCTHKGDCRNCPIFALQWREKVLETLDY